MGSTKGQWLGHHGIEHYPKNTWLAPECLSEHSMGRINFYDLCPRVVIKLDSQQFITQINALMLRGWGNITIVNQR